MKRNFKHMRLSGSKSGHSLTSIDYINKVARCSSCGIISIIVLPNPSSATPYVICSLLSRKRVDYHKQRQRPVGEFCEVCGTTEKLQWDHDHETNETRGTLCNTCNVALGCLKDDELLILKLLRYLRKSKLIKKEGVWITNGATSKRILEGEIPPNGWVYGRVLTPKETFSIQVCVVCKKEFKLKYRQRSPYCSSCGEQVEISCSCGCGSKLVRMAFQTRRPTFARGHNSKNVIFITDGNNEKHIQNRDPIPDGWREGRAPKTLLRIEAAKLKAFRNRLVGV